jgi:hypothetical protein
VKKVEEFRVHAQECRVMASGATSAEHRQMLFKMAATWDSLAEDREQNEVRRKRIAGLDRSGVAVGEE